MPGKEVSYQISSSATAEELMKEYKACESPDYISYVRIRLFTRMRFIDVQLIAGFNGT